LTRHETPDRDNGDAGGPQKSTKPQSTKPNSSTGRPTARQGPGRIAQTENEALRSRQSRRRTVAILAAVATVILAVTLAVTVGTGSNPSTGAKGAPTGLPVVPGPIGPENVPIEQGALLASGSSSATGGTVDGVECNSSEQVAYHVHTHLSVYVNGGLRPVPAGIGVVAPVVDHTPVGAFVHASQCYYWLHVHAQDGIIHIESPAGHSYVLGQFFDLWGQPLGLDQVGPASGPLTMWVDGVRYRGDPRLIPLGSHRDIQIDVGRPTIGPHVVRWSAASL